MLDPAQPPGQAPRPPWWRRILPSRERRPLAAGSRPRLRVRRRPRLTLPVLLIVLVVAAWLARAQLTELFNFAEDSTGDPKPLHPVHVRASSQAPSHRAQAAFDSLNNRYWAPAARGSGTGQSLEADFDRPVRLRELLVTSGISTKSDEYLSQARPSKITVTLVSSQGKHTTEKLNLNDAPGQQSFEVQGSDVTQVRLTVNAAYGTRPDRRVAIAEVEFFGRQ
ncbi:NADase-type glycan-binding domain-containing protein [Streptomyces sp. NPDC002671]